MPLNHKIIELPKSYEVPIRGPVSNVSAKEKKATVTLRFTHHAGVFSDLVIGRHLSGWQVMELTRFRWGSFNGLCYCRSLKSFNTLDKALAYAEGFEQGGTKRTRE